MLPAKRIFANGDGDDLLPVLYFASSPGTEALSAAAVESMIEKMSLAPYIGLPQGAFQEKGVKRNRSR